MTTALTIISDALTEIGVLGDSQSVSASDAAPCLRKLNQRLQLWSNARLLIPTLTEISVPLTGAQSYTIGPSGAVVAARPIKMVGVSAVDAGGLEYPVNVLNRSQWDSIFQKAVDGGPPTDVWYDAQNTNGRLYVYPKATSAYTLKVDCQTLLASFAATTDTVTLPDGYELLLTLTLAIDIAPAFGRSASADTKRMQAGALKVIKRTNAEPLLLSLEGEGMQDYQIKRGY